MILRPCRLLTGRVLPRCSLLLERRAALGRTSFASVAAAAPTRSANGPASAAVVGQNIFAALSSAVLPGGLKAQDLPGVQGGVAGGGEGVQGGLKEPGGEAQQSSLEGGGATGTAVVASAPMEEEGGSQEAKEEDKDVHSTQPPQPASSDR